MDTGDVLILHESIVSFSSLFQIRLEKWKGITKISGNTRPGFELEVATVYCISACSLRRAELTVVYCYEVSLDMSE
jgi:hypothetical protein